MSQALAFDPPSSGCRAANTAIKPLVADQWPLIAGAVHRQAVIALVVFAPALVLPLVGTAGDMALLASLYLAVLGLEAALALGDQATTGRAMPRAVRPEAAAAGCLAASVALASATLGLGAVLTLALYLAVRAVAVAAADRHWCLGLPFAAISTALLVDVALVALGLERSSLWLALAATVGMALSTVQAMADDRSTARDQEAERFGQWRTTRSLLELAFASLLALALALYGALLAHEPALRQLADIGGYLTVPVLALALLRLTFVALDHGRERPGPDILSVLLLAFWALSAGWLMEI